MAEPQPDEGKCTSRVPGVAIAAAGVAAVGALVFSRARRQARARAHEAALSQLAQEIGCTFTPARPDEPGGPDFPMMTGMHRGRTVTIDTEVAGSPLRYHCLTRATATHNAAVQGFVVVREETALTRVADALGLADIQVGEPAFDERFEVTSDLPNAARLLQPEVRDALMGTRFESFVIRLGEVTVRQEGPVADLATLRQSLKLAVDVAEWLEMLE